MREDEEKRSDNFSGYPQYCIFCYFIVLILFITLFFWLNFEVKTSLKQSFFHHQFLIFVGVSEDM